jgi:hypothetical protein
MRCRLPWRSLASWVEFQLIHWNFNDTLDDRSLHTCQPDRDSALRNRRCNLSSDRGRDSNASSAGRERSPAVFAALHLAGTFE